MWRSITSLVLATSLFIWAMFAIAAQLEWDKVTGGNKTNPITGESSWSPAADGYRLYSNDQFFAEIGDTNVFFFTSDCLICPSGAFLMTFTNDWSLTAIAAGYDESYKSGLRRFGVTELPPGSYSPMIADYDVASGIVRDWLPLGTLSNDVPVIVGFTPLHTNPGVYLYRIRTNL